MIDDQDRCDSVNVSSGTGSAGKSWTNDCKTVVVVYFAMDSCLLLLCLILFFSTKPRDWLGGMSPK